MNQATSHVFKLEFFEYSERVCSCDDCTYILHERTVVPSSLNHARYLRMACIAWRYTTQNCDVWGYL